MGAEDSDLIKYLSVNEAFDPIVDSDRRGFTFLSKKSGRQQVWEFDFRTFSSERLTDSEGRIRSVYHSPLGNNMIMGIDNEGDEKLQFYLFNKKNNKTEELVISQDHFHYFGGWSPDEKYIAFSSNRRDPGFFDLYITDLETKESQLLLEFNDKCIPLCWTKEGEHIIYILQETNIENSMYLLNINTKKSFKIGPKKTSARYQWHDVVKDTYQSPEFPQDGETGYILSDLNQDNLGIFTFSIAGPSQMQMVYTDDEWDIEEIALSPNEERICFSLNQGGISKLGIYSFENKSMKQIENLPTGVYESISWINNESLILGIRSALHPGDVWRVSLINGEVERLTFFGEEDIQDKLVEPELFSFNSFDGLEVPYFYYANSNKPISTILYVHGGPEHQIRHEFNPVIQFLVNNDFSVAAPNVRGSMGYGRKYSKLDDKRQRMNAVKDLVSLVKNLESNHQTVTSKVGIMGRSYGGFMVLAAMAHYPKIWSAGVDIVGIAHFKTFLENTGPWRRKLRGYEYGTLENDSDFFEEIAPLNHVDKINAPLLIFHGRNDTRVPVGEAEQMFSALKKQGKQTQLVIFEDEGHQTVKKHNHIKMNAMIVEFMERNLK